MLVMNSIPSIEVANSQYPNQMKEEGQTLDENVELVEEG